VFPGRSEATYAAPLTRVVYVERDDFREEDARGYFGLAPGKSVLLKCAARAAGRPARAGAPARPGAPSRRSAQHLLLVSVRSMPRQPARHAACARSSVLCQVRSARAALGTRVASCAGAPAACGRAGVTGARGRRYAGTARCTGFRKEGGAVAEVEAEYAPLAEGAKAPKARRRERPRGGPAHPFRRAVWQLEETQALD